MATKRSRFARRRKLVGFTQEELAQRLRVERTTVARWESGDTEPQPWVRPAIARLLAVSLTQLDDLLAQPVSDGPPAAVGQAGGDDVNRRELLRMFSVTGALVGLPPGFDVDRAGAASRMDRATLAEYSKLNGHLWQVFSGATTKSQVLPLARGQLDVLSDELGRTSGTTERQRLCVLIADLFQLVGEVYFDGNRYTDAAQSYTLAASAGKEAGAFDLWACALTRHAFVAIYDRQFAEAKPLLDAAGAVANQGDRELTTRHWIAAVEAEVLAGLGDHAGCERALDHAQTVAGTHNGGWLRFDGSRLAEQRGACYVSLGRLDLAEAALDNPGPLSPRRKASVLVDLAAIGVHRRDPDRVVSHAGAALACARQTGSAVVRRKLHGLRPRLAPMLGDKQISQLDAEIAEL